ncbi:MAG: aminotransferase class III-fold pyridoxal phosphate-dependent enzyme [Dehalococcoidia bacterium]|nr:aminotransferase class III-fold pyridoxal phosphate-dependent enzyme [Dehalococcoidia bacterium]
MNAESRQRTVAIVQARLGSVRMPRKVLSPGAGQPMLGFLLDRLGRAAHVDEIVLAIPNGVGDDELEEFAVGRGFRVVRGSEHDVLDRYHRAALASDADIVVRVTADCPLIDPRVVDAVIEARAASDVDYCRTGPTYPDGLDVEVATSEALNRAWSQASDPYDREHVMPFLQRDASSRATTIELEEDLGGLRLTVDEPEDLSVIRAVIDVAGGRPIGVEFLRDLLRLRPDLFEANRHLVRDEGAALTSGEKLWRRAKRVIPGGTMLLSKRSEQHLPLGWPAYFARASGCEVWDLDNVRYTDVGFMGVGTNILGYGYPAVDDAVRRTIDSGNLSTLLCPEEVELAEALVSLHPWSDMVRLTRSGGEACAVAVRIARAAAGRERVAFCGYHGWHDWYLAANLDADHALDGHLLQGLQPTGVPRGLASTARPFRYNDVESLEELLAEGDIGVIFMEVERSHAPKEGFLERVRALASEHEAVLVFDECTSGFRRVLGGTHLYYGVEPDLAVFGKTLGNGYAINAVVGRESVMQAAQGSFISSTFWTERIGPTAAVAALKAMEVEDAPARINATGLAVTRRWRDLADDVGLAVEVSGIPALAGFSIPGLDPVAVKTYVTQEMLAAGFLAGVSLYSSIAHTEEVLDAYCNALHPIFARLALIEGDDDLIALLPNGTAQRGFQRLA